MILPTKEFLKVFKETEGALSVAESIAIMNIAALAPIGVYVELGTHKGKSAISASYKLSDGIFFLVDPCFNEDNIDYFGKVEIRKIREKIWYSSFAYDMSPAYIRIMVDFIGDTSLNVLNRSNTFKYSYVFVDSGSHGDGLPIQESKLLEDRVVDGGIICFHDYKNQFVEVEGAYNYLLSTGKYEGIPIDWQPIFDYVNANDLENGNNSWHQYPDLNHPPNFVGALKKIK